MRSGAKQINGPAVQVPGTPTKPMTASLAAKRALDIAAGSAGLVVFLPVIGVLAVLTFLAQGPPIFFRQVRVGLGGSSFTLMKFRTMNDQRNSSGELLPDDDRTTSIGQFLRRFRLDELPSFLAVVGGEMSLVGPRPLPPAVLETIPGSAERHRVKPGFTGLAQVSGNTRLTNEEKIALDLHYARHWSLSKDIAILLKTVPTIVRGEVRDEPLIRRALLEQQESSMGGEARP